MKFAWIHAGCFSIGSPKTEKDRDSDEGPVSKVCIDGFWMGKYEVTQQQWRFIMDDNPSNFKKGDDFPVESVSWNDIQKFITKFNEVSGRNFRLPTEAEWEYSCRAATTSEFSFGKCISTDQSNYNGNNPYVGCEKGIYKKSTTKVGGYPANEFELYDMHGNVMEWCNDWYDKDYYRYIKQNNPNGPIEGFFKVVRGGCWYYKAKDCRSAFRYRHGLEFKSEGCGFRLVRK
jgi:formylglycine-generating enzyme required for sulfatase activity